MTRWGVAVAPDTPLQEVARRSIRLSGAPGAGDRGRSTVGLMSSLDFVRPFAKAQPAVPEGDS
jgi:hypothetical protein